MREIRCQSLGFKRLSNDGILQCMINHTSYEICSLFKHCELVCFFCNVSDWNDFRQIIHTMQGWLGVIFLFKTENSFDYLQTMGTSSASFTLLICVGREQIWNQKINLERKIEWCSQQIQCTSINIGNESKEIILTLMFYNKCICEKPEK